MMKRRQLDINHWGVRSQWTLEGGGRANGCHWQFTGRVRLALTVKVIFGVGPPAFQLQSHHYESLEANNLKDGTHPVLDFFTNYRERRKLLNNGYAVLRPAPKFTTTAHLGLFARTW